MHCVCTSKRLLTISRMTLVSRRSRSCVSDCQDSRSMECLADPMACSTIVLKLSSSRAGNSVALHMSHENQGFTAAAASSSCN